jgi:glycerate kinase
VTDIDLAPAQILLKNSTLVGLIDAQVPLLGPLGAARLYAPQKGASPSEVEELEMGLAHFERILSMTCGKSFAQELGIGAAGGLGLAIRALGGTLENGFGFVSSTLKLAEQIKDCDLILTGEGKLDESSRQGKVTVGVARLAKAAGKPCVAIVGALEPDLPWLKEEGFSKVIPLFDTPFTAPDDPRKEQVPQRLIEAIGKLLAGAQRIYS